MGIQSPIFNQGGGVYALLRLNYAVFPCSLGATYFGLRWLVRCTGFYSLLSEDDWNWTTVAHMVLNIMFLLGQLPPYSNTLGLCLPIHPFKYAQKPKQRSLGTLRVCLVTKGTNFQTALHSASHWANLRHPCLKFHVIVDTKNTAPFRQSLPSYIEIYGVPDSFQPAHARYKARALEYYRTQQRLTSDDWVLHLDEESEINESVIKACLDFIERGNGHIGMGTIFYNGANHWRSLFLSTAEVMRVAEDFGRFQLPVRFFRRPLLGWMHGSWVLVNGAVENDITWDTTCIAEDFWFAYNAASRGYKFGWLHAIVREQPPFTMGDFFKQRRRWYTGILSIDNVIVQLSLIMSVAGATCFFLLALLSITGYKTLLPQWYFNWLLWNYAANAHVLLVASVLQDMTIDTISWVAVIRNAVVSVVVAPVVHFLQAVALVSCLVRPARGFDVIRKV